MARSSVSDTVVRSQSGRYIQNTLTDVPTVETSTRTIDVADRLSKAVTLRYELTGEFDTADFEAPFTWAASGGTVAPSVAGTPAHAGTGSATLTQTGATVASMAYAVAGLIPGRTYRVQAWVAVPPGTAQPTTVTVGTISTGVTSTVLPASGATAVWSQVSNEFVATNVSTIIRVGALGTPAKAKLWVDDVTLTQLAGSSPETTVTAPQSAVTDSVIRSQSGRIIHNTLTDGATVETSTYTYDGAGRLTKAVIPKHELTYEFDQTSTCGVNTAAGRSGNRTGFTDVFDGAITSDVSYCYDNADRLTATTSSGSGASPVIDYDLHHHRGWCSRYPRLRLARQHHQVGG